MNNDINIPENNQEPILVSEWHYLSHHSYFDTGTGLTFRCGECNMGGHAYDKQQITCKYCGRLNYFRL